jgi:plastocyanin
MSSAAPAICPARAVTEAEIHDFEFEPVELTVAVGATLRWTNKGPSVHTVTADDGSFDSGGIAPGALFEHAFDGPGVFSYHCRPHPNMTGTIIVQ